MLNTTNWKHELTKTEYGHRASMPVMAISNRLRSLIGIARADKLERAETLKKQLIFITILLIINFV